MVAHLLAGAVGVVLAYAGAQKVTGWSAWMSTARAQSVWKPVAALVPVLELFLGACMVVLSPAAPVMGAATLLLLVFTAFLVVQVATRSQVPCACFGARAVRPPSGRDVLRNLAMIAALVVAAALG